MLNLVSDAVVDSLGCKSRVIAQCGDSTHITVSTHPHLARFVSPVRAVLYDLASQLLLLLFLYLGERHICDVEQAFALR